MVNWSNQTKITALFRVPPWIKTKNWAIRKRKKKPPHSDKPTAILKRLSTIFIQDYFPLLSKILSVWPGLFSLPEPVGSPPHHCYLKSQEIQSVFQFLVEFDWKKISCEFRNLPTFPSCLALCLPALCSSPPPPFLASFFYHCRQSCAWNCRSVPAPG